MEQNYIYDRRKEIKLCMKNSFFCFENYYKVLHLVFKFIIKKTSDNNIYLKLNSIYSFTS